MHNILKLKLVLLHDLKARHPPEASLCILRMSCLPTQEIRANISETGQNRALGRTGEQKEK